MTSKTSADMGRDEDRIAAEADNAWDQARAMTERFRSVLGAGYAISCVMYYVAEVGWRWEVGASRSGWLISSMHRHTGSGAAIVLNPDGGVEHESGDVDAALANFLEAVDIQDQCIALLATGVVDFDDLASGDSDETRTHQNGR